MSSTPTNADDHVCEFTPSLKHPHGTPWDYWVQVDVCMECGTENGEEIPPPQYAGKKPG